MGTLEAVQALQVQNGQLQKARETHHARCLELDRLRKESAPQKELEKVCVCVSVRESERVGLSVLKDACAFGCQNGFACLCVCGLFTRACVRVVLLCITVV